MRFTSKVAEELQKLLGINRNMSTAYHLQMDGQAKRTNQWLEQYLRIFTTYQQDDWSELLIMAEFMHNT